MIQSLRLKEKRFMSILHNLKNSCPKCLFFFPKCLKTVCGINNKREGGLPVSSLCMSLTLGWYEFKLDYYNLGCYM